MRGWHCVSTPSPYSAPSSRRRWPSHPRQPVIEAGPYRLIRHPSYTGFLITLLRLGLSLTNWLSLLVIMGCALLGVSYRIHVEEHVLQAQRGQRYQEYMRPTKRLIPFVL